MHALRKATGNIIFDRVRAATKAIHRDLHDLAIVYVFSTKPQFSEVAVAARKVVKAAGLDQLTPSDTIYRVSTGLPLYLMARKQVLQNALKWIKINYLGHM